MREPTPRQWHRCSQSVLKHRIRKTVAFSAWQYPHTLTDEEEKKREAAIRGRRDEPPEGSNKELIQEFFRQIFGGRKRWIEPDKTFCESNFSPPHPHPHPQLKTSSPPHPRRTPHLPPPRHRHPAHPTRPRRRRPRRRFNIHRSLTHRPAAVPATRLGARGRDGHRHEAVRGAGDRASPVSDAGAVEEQGMKKIILARPYHNPSSTPTSSLRHHRRIPISPSPLTLATNTPFLLRHRVHHRRHVHAATPPGRFFCVH